MKKPIKKKVIKELISTLTIHKRKVSDFIEDINKIVDNEKDLTFNMNSNDTVSIYEIREESENEFLERINVYNKFLENQKNKEQKKKEKEIQKKIVQVQKLQVELEKIKGNKVEEVSLKSLEEIKNEIKEKRKKEKELKAKEKNLIKQIEINEKVSSLNPKNRFEKI